MYTATKKPDGQYEIFLNGGRIATGSSGILPAYGLSPTQLSSAPPTNSQVPPSTPIQQTVTQPPITQGYVNPNQAAPGVGFGLPTSSITSPAPTSTGTDSSLIPPEFQGLYTQLQTYLDELKKRGQVLNPAIELTPDKVASFLQQAHTEIDPYYSNQLKLAVDSLSTSVNQGLQKLQTNEGRAQTTYQTGLRTLGENAADQGFAQSGIRNRNETTLANDTQNSLDDARNSFAQNVGDSSRSFATKYGTSQLPQFNITGAPTVTAGENTFGSNSHQLPMYQLSPEVYAGLTGSEQYQQRADVQNRASQLESAFRSNQALDQARQLNF